MVAANQGILCSRASYSINFQLIFTTEVPKFKVFAVHQLPPFYSSDFRTILLQTCSHFWDTLYTKFFNRTADASKLTEKYFLV